MVIDEIVRKTSMDIAGRKQKKRSLEKELRKEGISLIAEIKFASPSKGVFKSHLDPIRQAELYQKGGASAISIVTEKYFFEGKPDIIQMVAPRVRIPILRKDFIIDRLQIYETLFLGADALLLIASILTESQLKDYINLSEELGLEAVVEVHSKEDVLKAASTGAKIVGINNRNLADFSINLHTTTALLPEIRKKIPNCLVVSESGISTREDVEILEETGVDGILVGESIVVSGKPEKTIKMLLGEKT